MEAGRRKEEEKANGRYGAAERRDARAQKSGAGVEPYAAWGLAGADYSAAP